MKSFEINSKHEEIPMQKIQYFRSPVPAAAIRFTLIELLVVTTC